MWVIILLAIPVAIYAIWFEQHEKYYDDKKKCEKGEKEFNTNISLIATHVCGLPLGEKSKCKLYLTTEQIIIESNSSIFKLKKEKILDASMKTSKEVQNSISNAVGGAMLLGPIGVFLGGTETKIRSFLIYIYKDEKAEKCISFEIENVGKRFEIARKFLEDFENNIAEKKEVEL